MWMKGCTTANSIWSSQSARGLLCRQLGALVYHRASGLLRAALAARYAGSVAHLP
jgi:hypothetical protein